MVLLAKCFEHTHPLPWLSCQTTLEKHVPDDSFLPLGNWRELPWMQEQGGLMVEICIKSEITVVSGFYETLWTVLCNSFQLHIGSNSQTAKFWGHIFHGFCNPKIPAMPLFPSLRTQTYFWLSLVGTETSDSWKYVCVRRLPLSWPT